MEWTPDIKSVFSVPFNIFAEIAQWIRNAADVKKKTEEKSVRNIGPRAADISRGYHMPVMNVAWFLISTEHI